MKTTKNSVFILLLAVLTAACGKDSTSDYQPVGTRTYSFVTPIDVTTFEQGDDVSVPLSFSEGGDYPARAGIYLIDGQPALDSFNQGLSSDRQVSLPDLATHTYFFVRDPGDCSGYLQYSNHTYIDGILTFHLSCFEGTSRPKCSPPDPPVATYVVFRSQKSPAFTTDPNAKFVDSKTYSFNTSIWDTPISVEKSFSLFNSFAYPKTETYLIDSQAALDAFNQNVSADEQVSLDYLETDTYFLIRAPDCPNYYEYKGHSYINGWLTLLLHHATSPNVACSAVVVESYYVYRAHKRIEL